MASVEIDGVPQEAQPDELLIDLINRTGGSVPHVYHPQLGPVQTCDTCMVEGRLVRACATPINDGMAISTKSAKAEAAQVEAFEIAFGPLLIAYMRQATGSYGEGLHVIAGVMAVSVVLPVIVSPPR